MIQPYEYTYYLHPDQMLQVYSPDCGWTRQQQTEGYMLPIVCFQLQRWLSISTMHVCSAHCNAPHEAPDRQTNPLIIFISATVSYRLMSSRTFNSLGKKPKTRQIQTCYSFGTLQLTFVTVYEKNFEFTVARNNVCRWLYRHGEESKNTILLQEIRG